MTPHRINARRGGGRMGRRGGGGRPPSAPAWSPLDLTAMQHFYRGDDVVTASGAIATHVDMEASSDLEQATAGLRPAYSATIASLNNQPGGVYTRASLQWMRVGSTFAAVAQPFTVVLAWSHASIGVVQAIAGGSLGARWFIRASAANNLEFHAGVGTLATSTTVATATSYTGIFVFNGTSSKARVNGASVYAGATNVGAASASDVTVGRELVADHLDGSVAEVALLSGDLIADATNLALYESYLAARY
jgi:hypothetical protein